MWHWYITFVVYIVFDVCIQNTIIQKFIKYLFLNTQLWPIGYYAIFSYSNWSIMFVQCFNAVV